MYNEKTRKLTSLTLMTIMVAGGMVFAFPEMEPAYAASPNLSVSAEAVGNFAGIQVIEIVVNDPSRSSTNESEGVPNVQLNGDDVLMVQGNDGSWYAYVANKLAVDKFEEGNGHIIDIYGQDEDFGIVEISGSDSVAIYNSTDAFLDGYKQLSPRVENNPSLGAELVVQNLTWPFIQTYDISDNTLVTIKYGTGSTAQTVTVKYDYDKTKDLSFDRSIFPSNANIMLSLNDSLLNLSPIANDYWAFNSTSIFYLQDSDSTLNESNKVATWEDFGFEEGPLKYDASSSKVFSIQNSTVHKVINEVYPEQEGLIILRESDTDDNVFVNYDTKDKSNLLTNSAQVSGSGTLTYIDSHSIILDTFNGIIEFGSSLVDEWLSGVELDIELTDEDKNLNTRSKENLLILDGEVPFIKIGTPKHLDSNGVVINATGIDVGTDSKVFNIKKNVGDTLLVVNATFPYHDYADDSNDKIPSVYNYINFDFTELGGAKGTIYLGAVDDSPQTGTLPPNVIVDKVVANNTFAVVFNNLSAETTSGDVYFDILSFGQEGPIADKNGELNSNVKRVNDAFYRFELEETDDNTAKFTGTVEYIMINQLNVFDTKTYDSIKTANDGIVIIVNDDMDGTDAVTVSYKDIVRTGDKQTISVQEDANTHSGIISFDNTGYSSGNTITVRLEDVDLNTNSDTPQVYQINDLRNWIGDASVWLTQLTFNDKLYAGCGTTDNPKQSKFAFNSTGFSFIETGKATGIFEGTLKLPSKYCDTATTSKTTNGVDIEFVYQDYSDASGNPNETHTSAAVRSNTGSVSLDRTVYGLPFGTDDYETHPSRDTNSDRYLPATPVTFTIQVNDSDYNLAANGEDTLPLSKVELVIKRGSDESENYLSGLSGAFVETDPQSGIFEYDLKIKQGDSSKDTLKLGGLIRQGDVIHVKYQDDTDASGSGNTVTDSAVFDLRNAVLQSDKSVYIIGSDAIITLIEPDFNLDSNTVETLSLDLIEWDSDAGTKTLADKIFSAQPAGIRETGSNTGIFQVVIEIPKAIGNEKLERGEQIFLEYVDNGPAGADFIGDDSEDITLNMFTSNFGATVELDQKVYSWTDKVFITVVSPDHNYDSNAIDEIGGDTKIVQINTRSDKIKNYKFVETGPNTGIFHGEVILTGFAHDADGDGTDDTSPRTEGTGPTDGFIKSGHDDGLTVSFESSDNVTVTGTALIRWNIGEVQFLESSYPATGSGLVRVIDTDMNIDPEAVDSFDIDVWSDSVRAGIKLTVNETNEATGIFEASLFFTVNGGTSGSRLSVAEGDMVTARYIDHTLPAPFSTADEKPITATTIIGSIVPPLERAPANNLRSVDAFGNTLKTVAIDQQIQITSDLANNQEKSQKFAYLLQVQNSNGITVSLSWITGELTSGQKFSPAVSWVPQELGTFTATVFVWESVDNPTALSPPVETQIVVNN